MCIKKFRKLETTKRLLRMCMMCSTVVMISAIIYSYINNANDVFITVIEKCFELSAICVGFYVWKAKNENIRKYKEGGETDDA